MENVYFVFHGRKMIDMMRIVYDLSQIDRHSSAPKELDKAYGGAQKAPPVDLSACLDCFTTEETLTEENAWYCSQCKEFRCATKKMDLWSVPDILVIHLKRFQYTRAFRDKINTLVNFPLKNLDLSPWIVNENNKSMKYDLYAVSNHMGDFLVDIILLMHKISRMTDGTIWMIRMYLSLKVHTT
eukprot:TRINITY_DN3536_c0_g1_i1.p1 TRINITY_DN3536_c0_g1~~TRINITY_DN3536_c0_g1_i1.p1  ORF type:complete len:184 (-),score=29.35 TRINITY_DN3536_c0_g1_i1:268-819(-)